MTRLLLGLVLLGGTFDRADASVGNPMLSGDVSRLAHVSGAGLGPMVVTEASGVTTVYVTSAGSSHGIYRKVGNGALSLWLGGAAGDTLGTNPRFNTPRGLTYDKARGKLYVADRGNYKVKSIDVNTGSTVVLSGSGQGYQNGPGAVAKFDRPVSVTFYGSNIYVLDDKAIRKVDMNNNEWTSLFAGDRSFGYQDGPGNTAKFNRPLDIEIDSWGTTLYVVGGKAGDPNHRNGVRMIDTATRMVTTLAGGINAGGWRDGPFSSALFTGVNAYSIARDPVADNVFYIGDDRRIRVLDTFSKMVNTLAGSSTAGNADGPSVSATLTSPVTVAGWSGSTAGATTDKKLYVASAAEYLRVVTGSVATANTAASPEGEWFLPRCLVSHPTRRIWDTRLCIQSWP